MEDGGEGAWLGGWEGEREGGREERKPVKLLSSSLRGATGLPPEMEREEGMWMEATVREGGREERREGGGGSVDFSQ